MRDSRPAAGKAFEAVNGEDIVGAVGRRVTGARNVDRDLKRGGLCL